MLVKRLAAYTHQPFLRYSKLLVENLRHFHTPPLFSGPAGGDPRRNFAKILIYTRMNGLSCNEESMTICSAVLIQNQRVTNRWTDGRPAYS